MSGTLAWVPPGTWPSPDQVYDVTVVGAGLVGAAIARALAGYELSVAILDARDDVGDGTSKANTAILHTGFDATPGTLESRLVRRGYDLLSAYARECGIPVEPTGAVLVAWDDEQQAALPGLRAKASANGYQRTSLIDADEVYAMLPHLGPGVRAGLTVPDESVTCTWTTSLALATDAVRRGAHLLLGAEVLAVDVTGAPARDGDPHDAWTAIRTTRGSIRTRWLVNAAGLGSDHVDRMMGFDRFTITPRKGELLVFDKQSRPLARHIVLPVPSKAGKGVLISPTVYGNLMVGPTAQDIDDRTDTSTTEAGFAFLRDKLAALMPALQDEEITATYAGLRAATEHADYVVDVDANRRYAVAGGIRSTGLTACMAIAEHLIGLVQETGLLEMRERNDLPDAPAMPNLGEAFLRPYQDADRIAADPEYGHVICFCERVTAGEIRDALAATIPPTTLGGLRRRTRVMNGRCQGFFCGAQVRAMLDAAGRDRS
ncbi:MAG: NAD(P)/FAD-dependent oxidoreductase [Actinomycetales bacterium]|nr:NAD(P)/FAD-dependent oxidoreductase [Actinomycetales bacterium]